MALSSIAQCLGPIPARSCEHRRPPYPARASQHRYRLNPLVNSSRGPWLEGGRVQVPAYVEYEKATSVGHALALLARFGPEARILAGGHSLIPMMKLRLAQPETLIDINGLSELSYITVTAGELRIGALTRHAQLLDSGEAARHFAVLHDAEQVIADPVVRNWGTIGGSLCPADPSEDLSAAFAALKGSMIIQGPDGSRAGAPRAVHTR